MKLGYIIMYVKDVAATVAFYERAFGLSTRYRHEGGHYAEMDTGATILTFATEELVAPTVPPYRPNDPEHDAPGIQIALVTPDVAGGYASAVSAGAAALTHPVQKAQGQTVAYVRDNNGFIVEICSPVGPEHT